MLLMLNAQSAILAKKKQQVHRDIMTFNNSFMLISHLSLSNIVPAFVCKNQEKWFHCACTSNQYLPPVKKICTSAVQTLATLYPMNIFNYFFLPSWGMMFLTNLLDHIFVIYTHMPVANKLRIYGIDRQCCLPQWWESALLLPTMTKIIEGDIERDQRVMIVTASCCNNKRVHCRPLWWEISLPPVVLN